MRLKPLAWSGVVVTLIAGVSADSGQAPPPAAMPTYQVASVADFALEGRGSAPAWSRTAWAPLTPRVAPAGGDSPPRGDSPHLTRFKMLYSSTGLYVLMDSEDRTLTATMKEDFLDLWTEDVFEFFLWPDDRYPVYFEYEISPLGYELPILVPNLGGPFYGWRPWHYEGARKTKKAVSVRGGPATSGATIAGWSAEVFVPWDLLKPLQNVPPKSGTRWRANLYRMDYDGGRTVSWNWAPIRGTFHQPDKFGTLVFE